MAQQNVARLAFNRGRVSPLALARTDIERVELSAEEQTNFVPRVLGSMMLRPGFKYLNSTLGDNRAYHVDFVKSTDDTSLLEFTNGSLRAYTDDALVERETVSTVTRGGDFSADVTNFLKITNPSSLPADGGDRDAIAWSPDGQFMFATNDTSPFHKHYYISGSTFTALSNLGTTPSATTHAAAYSPDSQLLIVTDNDGSVNSYYVTGTGASATWTQTASTIGLAAIATGVSWSPDQTMVAFSLFGSSNVAIYSVTGTGSGVVFAQLADPATLPTGNGQACAFSWNGRFFAVGHATTPFVTIYEVNGTTFTKLSNPASLPTGGGTSGGVAFSRDGNWLSVAHDTTPFVTNYAISGTTFTKASNPATLPTGDGTQVSFSSDNQFIAVSHSVSPYVTIYRNVAGVWTKQTNPATLPTGNAYGVGFSHNNRWLAVNHQVTPFITIYEAYQWLDMDGSGASSTYGSSTFATTFTQTMGSTPGVALTTRTVRQRLPTAQLTRSGDRVRITFEAAAADTFTISKCYLGLLAAAGDPYDFASAPTQITFSGGSPGFTISNSSTIVSDEISFNFDLSQSYICSFYIPGTDDGCSADSGAGADLTAYYKSGDDAATVNATGYTSLEATKDCIAIKQVEVAAAEVSVGGLSLVGTGYAEARRVQAISIIAADQDVEHAIRVVIQQGSVQFHVGSSFGGDDYVASHYLEPGTHTFAFTPTDSLFFIEVHAITKYSSIVSSIQIEAAGDMVLPTPYLTDDLSNLRYWQSGDVLYLACKDKKQMKVLRYDEHSWGIVDYLPPDGPFREVNSSLITLTASALTGNITLTASRDLFKEAMVGTLFRINSVGQATQDSFTAQNQFSSEIKVTGVGTTRDLTIVRSGTWSATVTLQRSISEPGTWVDVATFTTNGTATYNDGLDNQTIYYRVGIKTGNYTSGTAVISQSYASGTNAGVARVTAYTSPTVVSAIVLDPMGGTSAFENWSEGLWSEYRGFPSAVAIYESRLAWAGNDRVALSVSDEYESFDDTVEGDSGPILRSIGEGPVDDINWLLPLQRLLVGAQGSERSCRSTSFDEPLTPDNFNMKPASTQGSASVGAIIMDSGGAFVDRTGTRLFQLIYNFDTYDYSASELTRLVPEIAASGIVRIAVQRRPDTRVHCVLGDGTAAMLVFEKEEDTICWVNIETDGDIEDVCVLPDTPEDAVYYTVKRVIGGVDMRFLERWAIEDDCQGGTKNKQADSFIEYTSISTATLTGLDHLEGEEVVCWADGIDQGTFTVSGGSITLLGTVSNAIVGLPYTARYKSTKLAYAAAAGTALTRRKRVEQIGLILSNTHHEGLRIGDDYNFLRALPTVINNKAVADNTVHAEFDHDMNSYNTKWSTDSRVCLEAEAPRPVTILALTFGIETTG